MGLAHDTLSWYVENIWQVILKSVHIRESHSADTTAYIFLQVAMATRVLHGINFFEQF